LEGEIHTFYNELNLFYLATEACEAYNNLVKDGEESLVGVDLKIINMIDPSVKYYFEGLKLESIKTM